MYNWNPKFTKPGCRGSKFYIFLFFLLSFPSLPPPPCSLSPSPSLSSRKIARVAIFYSAKVRDAPLQATFTTATFRKISHFSRPGFQGQVSSKVMTFPLLGGAVRGQWGIPWIGHILSRMNQVLCLIRESLLTLELNVLLPFYLCGSTPFSLCWSKLICSPRLQLNSDLVWASLPGPPICPQFCVLVT